MAVRTLTGRLGVAAPKFLAELVRSHPVPVARKLGGRYLRTLGGVLDPEALRLLRMRWQVMLGDRNIRVGIYDHALHFVGGGQKYVLTMADALRARFQIEYIAHRRVSAEDLSRWHGLPADFPVKVIPLPAFKGKAALDQLELVVDPARNPFDAVSRRSARYDFFINANMLARVRPRAGKSVFVCHFPDQKKNKAWYADRYDVVINNSAYTARWMRILWGMRNPLAIHPPVDMNGGRRTKQNIILSVARFEATGSKKQWEMVEAFARLCRDRPDIQNRWRLVLCGGSVPGEKYIKRVAARHLQAGAELPIDIKTNIGAAELRELYAVSKIFWHLCGLGETEPERFEHFGMATVEAMRNYCVPVVFNGGGQREIVEHGRSGFLVGSTAGLRKSTLGLIEDPARLRRTASAARRRSEVFSADAFRGKVAELFDRLEADYRRPA